MAVHRTKVPEAQGLEKHTGGEHGLHAAFHAVDGLTDPVAQAVHGFRDVVDPVPQLAGRGRGEDLAEVVGQGPHVGCDRHLVVVQNNKDVALVHPTVVHGLVGQTTRHGTVADHGYDLVVLLELVACGGHSKCRRDRSGSMAGTKVVVLTLRALEEARQAPFLTNGVEFIFAARKDLVRISLVPRVQHDLVVRSVEDIVQSYRELHHTESGTEVSANLGNGVHEKLAHFIRHLAESRFRQFAKVLGGIDLIEILVHQRRGVSTIT